MALAEPFRTLRWATWLGWQIESNWASVRLFLLYMVLKPVSGSMMLVMMFYAAKYITNGRVPAEFLPYIYVSSACYGLVGRIMFGLSNVVISDRENYRMLKYIFISPAQFQAYFLGRGVAAFAEGVLGATITITVGLLIPDVRRSVNYAAFDPGWLVVYLGVGSIMLWACGMILASAMLNMSRSGTFLSEGIAGVLYFLSGVVFPITVLPAWLQPVGLSLPTTYWLEGMRRAITGPAPATSPLAKSPLAEWTNAELAGMLAITTAVLVIVSQWFYRRSVKRAWRRGKIEEATGM
jgi:ABC-2 type transport system permease protein